MPDSPQLSIYTPSNTEPEILEKIFVQRHKLLERTVAWCEESITTDKKNHLLFIGPRGSGKTHFIAMVVNRLKNKAEIKEKMLIIWLGEDDVITGLKDLLLLMIERLVKNNPERFNKTCLQQAKGQKPDTVAEIIMHSITEQIGQQTILLVKENMSDVFAGLKDSGQKKLRAFLQEKNNIAILGTSQQLFSGVSSRDAAFFGFFDTHHLKILTVDEAKQLISNIAKLNNNQKLIDFIESPQGCYRVRALHHLAGGNHRLYVELSSFLTMESLDGFVSALTLLADSLTPYFQERVRSLPAQQGRIVQKLCELQGATPVKMIAEETFIGERSVAKQLGDLAKKGYVISHKRGKQSYYEMAEPLMRLALEVKNSQGKPLKMVALLLRAWFSDNELQTVDDKHGITADYKIAALSMDKEFLVAINDKIAEQVIIGIESNDYKKITVACSEIINGSQTDGVPMVQKCMAIYNRGYNYYLRNKLELALQDFTALLEMQDAPKHAVNRALFSLPEAHFKLLQIKQAQQSLNEAFKKGDKASEYYPSNTNNILQAINQLGSSFWQDQIAWIIPLYAKHKELGSLSTAIIHSVTFFIEDESMLSSINKWQQLWQKHGEKYPELQLSLQVLQASVLTVEQKNDKPLFALPKEVRELVLPLLSKVLN